MKNKELRQFLESRDACEAAMNWLGDRDSAKMWAECERPDWLIWWAGHTVPRQELVLAACDCAETALRYVPKGEDRPRLAIETARRWARGEATVEEVRASDVAALAAACNAGYAVATAAYADADAACAAYAAADAARAADAAARAADAYAASAAADAADAAAYAALTGVAVTTGCAALTATRAALTAARAVNAADAARAAARAAYAASAAADAADADAARAVNAAYAAYAAYAAEAVNATMCQLIRNRWPECPLPEVTA
jgi:hypothetical protein